MACPPTPSRVLTLSGPSARPQIFIISLLWNWAALCADLHFVGAIAIGQWMLAVIFLLAGAPGAWFLWHVPPGSRPQSLSPKGLALFASGRGDTPLTPFVVQVREDLLCHKG